MEPAPASINPPWFHSTNDDDDSAAAPAEALSPRRPPSAPPLFDARLFELDQLITRGLPPIQLEHLRPRPPRRSPRSASVHRQYAPALYEGLIQAQQKVVKRRTHQLGSKESSHSKPAWQDPKPIYMEQPRDRYARAYGVHVRAGM